MNVNQNIIQTEYKSSVPIKGICHEDFQNVAETFAINFDKYTEIGSSLCVIVDGEVTVNLFAGHTSNQKNVEWNENTLAVAFSCTKAAVALCAHILIDKGLLNSQEKVLSTGLNMAKMEKKILQLRCYLIILLDYQLLKPK